MLVNNTDKKGNEQHEIVITNVNRICFQLARFGAHAGLVGVSVGSATVQVGFLMFLIRYQNVGISKTTARPQSKMFCILVEYRHIRSRYG